MSASSPAAHPEYELLSVVGTGGFGTVYRASFRGEGGFTKEVAIKLLREELGANDEGVQRLRDEARLLGLLRHRAVVAVDRLMAWEGRWALVMEYVEGQDLAQVVARGAVPVGPVLEIAAEVASALDVGFHRIGPEGQPLRLLHRDIKPSNIRLTPYGDVKVLDFGVARADFAGREAMTHAVVLGTLGYMAPERLDGQPDGPQADVYALGVVMFEALTGMALGRASANRTRHERKRAAAKLALQHIAHLPELAIDLVMEMLSFAPEDRPSARAVETRARGLARSYGEESLRAWVERRIGTGAPESSGPPVASTPRGPLSAPEVPSVDPASPRPPPGVAAARRRSMVATLALTLGVGIGLLHLVTRAGSMDPQMPASGLGTEPTAPVSTAWSGPSTPAPAEPPPTPAPSASSPKPATPTRVPEERSAEIVPAIPAPQEPEPPLPSKARVRVVGDDVPVCLRPAGGDGCVAPDARGEVPSGAYQEVCGRFPSREAGDAGRTLICKTVDAPLRLGGGEQVVVRCSLAFSMCSVDGRAQGGGS